MPIKTMPEDIIYDRVNQYQTAYPLLHKAVTERPTNQRLKTNCLLTTLFWQFQFCSRSLQTQRSKNKQPTLRKNLLREAVATSDEVIATSPNNVVFWKTRVRIYYTLAQADQRYLAQALTAIKKAAQLAPTDADISYNLGILYGQNGDSKNAVATLQNTIKLKQDFSNAYYALGIFYHQLAIDNKGVVVNKDYQQKAVDTMNFMLKNVAPGDSRPIDALKAWGK
jgi:putative inorganic carbon (HCO3(-)) transporter